jgi:glutamyl-tRNA synthetase
MRTLKDYTLLSAFLAEAENYPADFLSFKKAPKEETAQSLGLSLELLQTIANREYSLDRISHYFNHLIAQNGFTPGQVLHPLRVALTGLQNSPGAFEIIEVLGKQESIARVKAALGKLKEK